MGGDLLSQLLAAVAALIASAFATLLSGEFFHRLAAKLLGAPPSSPRPFSERLAELTSSLTKASQDVDSIIRELAQVARDRESAVRQLEVDLSALSEREQDMRLKIQALEATPLPVADHFARLIDTRDKRSARRDYALFAGGVVVTTVIGILIQLVGL